MPQIDQPHKIFYDLPDIIAIQQEISNTENIAIIPVFSDIYFETNNFPAYLKSAIYSRQTFLLHSDACEMEVPIKLYIEEACREIATPILEKNKVNENDVLWFTPQEIGSTWGRLGKKLCLYWDKQLAHYTRVIYWDADMFKLPDIYPSPFARMMRAVPCLTFLVVNHKLRRDWRPKMIRDCVKHVRYNHTPIQEMFEDAGLGRVLQNVKGQLAKPIGGFCIFPAKDFNENHKDFLEWLENHAPYIGDDEICIALASHKFNIFLQSFFLGWTHVSIRNYLLGNINHPLLHGRTDNPEYRDILVNITDSEGLS